MEIPQCVSKYILTWGEVHFPSWHALRNMMYREVPSICKDDKYSDYCTNWSCQIENQRTDLKEIYELLRKALVANDSHLIEETGSLRNCIYYRSQKWKGKANLLRSAPTKNTKKDTDPLTNLSSAFDKTSVQITKLWKEFSRGWDWSNLKVERNTILCSSLAYYAFHIILR